MSWRNVAYWLWTLPAFAAGAAGERQQPASRADAAAEAKPPDAAVLGPGQRRPDILNEGRPLLIVPTTAPSGNRSRHYRDFEGGLRFFFVPIDSLFRRVEQQRLDREGRGGSLAEPVTADGRPTQQTEEERALLRTYDELMLKGIRFFRDRDYERAAKQFRLGHVAVKRDVSSRIYLAVAFYAMGAYDESLATLRQAYELYPGLWSLPFDLRMEYVKEQEHKKHLDRLRRRVVSTPPNMDLKILLGAMYHFSGMAEEAERHLAKAVEKVEDDPMLLSLYEAVRSSGGAVVQAVSAEAAAPPEPDVGK